jgi:hypothetical protein
MFNDEVDEPQFVNAAFKGVMINRTTAFWKHEKRRFGCCIFGIVCLQVAFMTMSFLSLDVFRATLMAWRIVSVMPPYIPVQASFSRGVQDVNCSICSSVGETGGKDVAGEISAWFAHLY